MATNSFNISYVIKAVDKFSPVVKNVQKSLKSLEKRIKIFAGKDLDKFSDKIIPNVAKLSGALKKVNFELLAISKSIIKANQAMDATVSKVKKLQSVSTKANQKLADTSKKIKKTNAEVIISNRKFDQMKIKVTKVKDQVAKIPPKIKAASNETVIATSKAKRLGNAFKKAGEKAKGIGRGLALRATAPILGLFAASVAAAKTQEEAEARVEIGLKNLGKQAVFTKKELLGMAGALQDISVFGDEQFLEEITAPLLEVDAIAKNRKLFEEVQLLIVNIASKKNIKNFTGITKLMGQALSDPTLGANQLKRFVNLSDEVKEDIKALQEGGQISAARLILLGKLQKTFKGAAKELRSTDFGQITGNLNLIGDASEPIGKLVIKGLIPLSEILGTLLKKWLALNPQTQDMVTMILALVAVVAPLLIVLGFVATGIAAIGAPIAIAIIAIAALIIAFVTFKDDIKEAIIDIVGEDGFDAMITVMEKIKTFYIGTFKLLISLVTGFFKIIGSVIKFFTGGRKKFLGGIEIEEFRKIAFEAQKTTPSFGDLTKREEPLGEVGRNFGIRSSVDVNMNIRDRQKNVESVQTSGNVTTQFARGSNMPELSPI